MSSDRAALQRVVGDVDGFLGEAFGRQPVHAPDRDADGFADLLSLDAVDELVTSTALRAPSFRLVRDGRTLERSRVTRSARIGSRRVDDLIDVSAVHREFAAGATIVLQGLHRSFPPVSRFCRALERALTHPVQANAYLTPPAAQGLHLHGDPHDVFALQTYGVKRWVVHPPDGAELWDLELRPGDALYLPAGTRHAAQTIDRPSLHLTIGIRTVTWRDVVQRAVTSVLDDPELDVPLPAGWAKRPEELEHELAERLTALADRLRDRTEPVRTLVGHAEAIRELRPAQLHGGIRDVLEASTIDDTTPLCTRGDQQIVTDDDVVRLELADRVVAMPAALEEVLRELLARERFAPKELDAWIDEPSRLVLCRRLLREGVLTIEREPRGRW